MFRPSDQDVTLRDSIQDWVIPSEGGEVYLGEEDLEDFVIGQDLLADLEREMGVGQVGSEFETLGETLLQDVGGVVDEMPLGGDQDVGEMAGWIDLPSTEGELVGDKVSLPEGLDEDFYRQSLALQEMEQVSRRVFRDCQGLLETYPGQDSLTTDELETLEGKFKLDRDLIDQHTENLQAWLNRSILQGDLEEMRRLNHLKASLAETHFLLRRLTKQFFPEYFDRKGVDPDATPNSEVQVETQTLVDVPEFSQTPYAIPIGRNLRKKKGKSVVHKTAVFEHYTPSKRTMQWVVLALLFLMIPASYNMSAQRGMAERTELDPYQFSTIIPLKKAAEIQDNFVGQVQENWLTISDKEKRKQVTDLINVVGKDKYRMVALYYPNGKPAVNVILGNIIIY